MHNQKGKKKIYERIDKGVCLEDWMDSFPTASILNLPILIPYYSPIILELKPNQSKKKTSYKFEYWCLSFKDLKNDLIREWAQPFTSSPMYSISRKMGQIKAKSYHWCRKYKKEKNLDWEDVTKKNGGITDNLQQQATTYPNEEG